MNDDKNSPADKIVGSSDGLEPLHILMGRVFDEEKRPMSATDMTKALASRGWLPQYHTVIDVADEMKAWFGSNAMLSGTETEPTTKRDA